MTNDGALLRFFWQPREVVVDDDDVPERCEVYDPEQGTFVARDDLTVDVISAHGSRLISEDEFQALLARVISQR